MFNYTDLSYIPGLLTWVDRNGIINIKLLTACAFKHFPYNLEAEKAANFKVNVWNCKNHLFLLVQVSKNHFAFPDSAIVFHVIISHLKPILSQLYLMHQ